MSALHIWARGRSEVRPQAVGDDNMEIYPQSVTTDPIHAAKTHQVQHLCEILVADNMPFDSSEMRKIAAEYGFTINTSSPERP